MGLRGCLAPSMPLQRCCHATLLPCNAAAWPCNAAACPCTAPKLPKTAPKLPQTCNDLGTCPKTAPKLLQNCPKTATILVPVQRHKSAAIMSIDHVTRSCYLIMLLDHVTRSVQYQSIPRCNRNHSTTESTFDVVHLMDRSTLVYIYIYI